jgi:hypothetical protein
MPFVNRYSKKGCSSVKDIDWKKIAANCKIEVPIMIVSSVQKQLAKAKGEFDVALDQDDGAGKARIVLSKVGPKDIVVDWAVGASREMAKGVSKVRTELGLFANTNKTYLEKIEAVKVRVKEAKESVKYAESRIGSGQVPERVKNDLNQMMDGLKDQLGTILSDGRKLFREHQEWYLNGPRKGVAPLMKKEGLEMDKLDPVVAKEFASALSSMSDAANAVKKVWDVDIEPVVPVLTSRLDNLASKLNKGHSSALSDIETEAGKEVEALRTLVGKLFAETKAEKSINLADSIVKKGSHHARLVKDPKLIDVEMLSNKTRLATIPKFLELVKKQASRIEKSIPSDFRAEGKLPGLIKELKKLVDDNTENMRKGKEAIDKADKALTDLRNELGG